MCLCHRDAGLRGYGLNGMIEGMTDSQQEESTEAFIVRRLGELSARLDRLNSQTEFETSEDNAGILHLQRRMTDLAERLTAETKRINYLRQMVHDFENRMSTAVTEIKQRIGVIVEERLTERVTALENGSRLVGTGGLIDQIMSRLAALEGFARNGIEPEFSPPIGGRLVGGVAHSLREVEQRFAAAMSGPDVIHIDPPKPQVENAFERGYVAGRRAAVDEAVSRVESWLDANWPDPTPSTAILNQIRAVVETKIEHVPAEEAGLTVQRHTARVFPDLTGHQSPIAKGRPIRDNPQA